MCGKVYSEVNFGCDLTEIIKHFIEPRFILLSIN